MLRTPMHRYCSRDEQVAMLSLIGKLGATELRVPSPRIRNEALCFVSGHDFRSATPGQSGQGFKGLPP